MNVEEARQAMAREVARAELRQAVTEQRAAERHAEAVRSFRLARGTRALLAAFTPGATPPAPLAPAHWSKRDVNAPLVAPPPSQTAANPYPDLTRTEPVRIKVRPDYYQRTRGQMMSALLASGVDVTEALRLSRPFRNNK